MPPKRKQSADSGGGRVSKKTKNTAKSSGLKRAAGTKKTEPGQETGTKTELAQDTSSTAPPTEHSADEQREMKVLVPGDGSPSGYYSHKYPEPTTWEGSYNYHYLNHFATTNDHTVEECNSGLVEDETPVKTEEHHEGGNDDPDGSQDASVRTFT